MTRHKFNINTIKLVLTFLALSSLSAAETSELLHANGSHPAHDTFTNGQLEDLFTFLPETNETLDNRINLTTDFLGSFQSASERAVVDFTLEFQRLKSRLILRTMDAIVPSVLFMQSSLCDLLASPSPTKLNTYEEANQKAEEAFSLVENWLDRTRNELDTCGLLHEDTNHNLQSYRMDIVDFISQDEPDSNGNGNPYPNNNNDNLRGANKRKSKKKSGKKEKNSNANKKCGGRIQVSRESRLNFTSFMSDKNEEEEYTFCLWILYNDQNRFEDVTFKISPIAVDLKGGTLTLHRNFQGNESPAVNNLQVGFSMDFVEVAVLIFTKYPPEHKTSALCDARRQSGRQTISSFSLKFEAVFPKEIPVANSTTTSTIKVQTRPRTTTTTTTMVKQQQQGPEGYHTYGWPRPMSPFLSFLSYPVDRDAYWPHERTFFIFYPGPKSVVELSLRRLNTEPLQDFLSIFKYNRYSETFQFVDRKSGRFAGDGTNLYEGHQGDPLLLYFHSDDTRSYAGFQLAYGSRDL